MENGTVAWFALVVSILSLVVSACSGWFTRDHNKRTVKPFPYVANSNFEDLLRVRLWNYGSGPLILKKVMAKEANSNLSGHLIDLLPPLPEGLYYKNYVKIAEGRAIPPGESITLVEFTVDESNKVAIAFRDELRAALGYIAIDVQYTDIYESKFDTYSKELKWFHGNKDTGNEMQPGRYISA